jgi:hypothetical protein
MITKDQQDKLDRLVGKTVRLPYSQGTMIVDGLDLPDDLESDPLVSDVIVYGTVTPLDKPVYPTDPTEPYEGWARADQVKVV